jgi:hypothetical protein
MDYTSTHFKLLFLSLLSHYWMIGLWMNELVINPSQSPTLTSYLLTLMQCLWMNGLLINPFQHPFLTLLTHSWMQCLWMYGLHINPSLSTTLNFTVTFLDAMSMDEWISHQSISIIHFRLHCLLPGCNVYECMDYTSTHLNLPLLVSLSNTWKQCV